jgi:hypothetical protein
LWRNHVMQSWLECKPTRPLLTPKCHV